MNLNDTIITLGIVCHKAFWFDGKDYYTSNAFGRYVDTLASHFNHVILCVPVAYGKSESHQDSLLRNNISYLHLPYIQEGPGWGRKWKLLIKIPKIWKLLRWAISKCDIIHPRVPGHIGMIGFFIGFLVKKPMFTSVVGDWGGRILSTHNSTVRRLIAWIHDLIIKYMCRHSIAFIQGMQLQLKYGSQFHRSYQFVSSSLSDKEICDKIKNFPINSNYYNILYVGNLTKEKGLLYLLNAVKILSDKGMSIQVHLVGEGTMRSDIIKVGHELGIESKILLHGYVPWGQKLFYYYRNSDIFVLPSLSEGTPKVLLESMANGTPVITTNVGGISGLAIHKENAILVKPYCAESIAEAIYEITKNESLRNYLIAKGFETAKQHTIEREVAKMIEIINSELHL